MYWRKATTLILVTMLCLPACNGTKKVDQQDQTLRLVNDCSDLEASVRKAAINQMREQVNQQFYYYLKYGSLCIGYEDSVSGGTPNTSAASKSDTSSVSEYSTTNVQEQGVDEADYLKNDGSYIYLLGGSEFRIYKAWPAAETTLLSSFNIEGQPHQIYVVGDRALVYSFLPVTDSPVMAQDCIYRFACLTPYGDLKITVLDIKDRSNPALVRELFLSGSYVNSRRINDAVYTVLTFPGIHFDGLTYWPEGLTQCGEAVLEPVVRAAFDKLIEKNEQIILNTSFTDWLPAIKDHRILANGSSVTDTDLLGNCENFYEPADALRQGFLSIFALNMLQDSKPQLTSIVGDQGVVYASTENLYVAGSTNSYYWMSDYTDSEKTVIHKFSLATDSANVDYEASGQVEGRVLNQFSLGEWEGYLRVATTTGYLPNPKAHNSLFILGENEHKLQIVGSVTDIAPGEDIRSSRFFGKRGFIVTFKKTDPLFALDLSDPTNPKIAGELKIPGFSTYLHPMDENHLLTIGFDASDQGDFAWFTGLRMQIFDVTDLTNPALDHYYDIGTRGSSSEATSNHLAFNYFAPKNILALPMVICEGGDLNGGYGSIMSFDGLIVFDVTTAEGFKEHGRVSHQVGDSTDTYCGTWWADPNSGVKRSIIMDNFVYSISGTLLKVNDLANLSTDLVTLTIPPIPQE
jgi:Secreted protein containing C-terminal beta-propeller domain distantly related to WD-40 repeats